VLSGVGPAGNAVLELITIANREFAWCDKEILRASNEMGFGDDWKKAQEAVKNKYVEPGEMVKLVRDLSKEAIELLTRTGNDPCDGQGGFLGAGAGTAATIGEPFLSGRRHYSSATVFNEYAAIHDPEVSPVSGPLQHTVLDRRDGVLLGDSAMGPWVHAHTGTAGGRAVLRMHRCARIIFSLNFPLGKMTALECVRFLVERVGFERANAEGEVRRSFNGSSTDLPVRVHAGRAAVLRAA
jgi:hypothetical protein